MKRITYHESEENERFEHGKKLVNRVKRCGILKGEKKVKKTTDY